jgi:murein DD-endopeptidase MepM/ murein hydrolase activator NlpD
MQRVRTFLVALAGILALAMLVFPPADDSPPPPAPASTLPSSSNASVNAARPTDSIRTDLNDYRWPTDAGHLVTSTFGEYRRTHFHGGIDISTGDDTGYRVFAARDGDVGRVRVDANGYGKILFLRHSDGYWTTYAHLRSFAPAIEGRVHAEQLRLQRYPVQLEFTL